MTTNSTYQCLRRKVETMCGFTRCNLVFSLALSLVILYGAPWARAQEGLLDGRDFVGESREIHVRTARNEEIKFVNGELEAILWAGKDFKAGAYTAAYEKDAIVFEAETTSPKKGTIKWRGIVRGDAIEVNYQWHQKGWLSDTVRDYAFKGSQKK
jgi:hypothetical protein